jgi:hypothetical protein
MNGRTGAAPATAGRSTGNCVAADSAKGKRRPFKSHMRHALIQASLRR